MKWFVLGFPTGQKLSSFERIWEIESVRMWCTTIARIVIRWIFETSPYMNTSSRSYRESWINYNHTKGVGELVALTNEIIIACVIVFFFGIFIYTRLLQLAREMKLGVDVGKPLLVLLLIFWGAILTTILLG